MALHPIFSDLLRQHGSQRRAAVEFNQRPGESGMDRDLRLVADAPLDLSGLTRQEVRALDMAAYAICDARRDLDGSAADLQFITQDRLAIIDGRERRRPDLVEAAQARRVERARSAMAKAA